MFAWILWGDFCFTLMELVVPSILPLKLKTLETPNWLIGVIMTTVPGVLNMTICPWVSFKSDRYRSRWGRRIPFILWTLPFLTLSLVMLGCSEEIRHWLQDCLPPLRTIAPVTLTILLIGLFMAVFQFFNMFVASVFFYLFNDVVPRQFIGRFIGLLRIASTLAGMVYHYFVFRYANTHMREILLGAAFIYFVFVGLMCLKVKEGQYPPPEGESEKDRNGFEAVKTFLRECFTHKFYWLVFLSTGLASTTTVINTFNVFFQQEMGLSVEQNDIGTLNMIGGGASLMAMYLSAMFVDRWHPLRVGTYIAVFAVIANAMTWVWVFVSLPGTIFFWLSISGLLIATFHTTLSTAASLPRDMRLFPTSRFGQFCSAQAMFRSLCTIVAGLAAGLFIDATKSFCGDPNFAYRFIFVWSTVFSILTAIVTVMMYRHWYRLGGSCHFHPPAPWSPKGVEEQPIVPTIGPQSRWLKVSFRLFDAIMAFSVFGIFPMMWWMHRQGALVAYHWFGGLLLPASAAAWLWWAWLKHRILKDIECSQKQLIPANGIPHHGMLMVMATKFLLSLGLWVAQVSITVNRHMAKEAIVFGLANVMTNFMLIAGVQLMCRIERNYSTTIDAQV